MRQFKELRIHVVELLACIALGFQFAYFKLHLIRLVLMHHDLVSDKALTASSEFGGPIDSGMRCLVRCGNQIYCWLEDLLSDRINFLLKLKELFEFV